jgi:hypothetical protein
MFPCAMSKNVVSHLRQQRMIKLHYQYVEVGSITHKLFNIQINIILKSEVS